MTQQIETIGKTEQPPILAGSFTSQIAERVKNFSLSVAEIFERWVERRASPHTRRAYRQDVMAIVAHLGFRWPDDSGSLFAVKVSDVQAWRDGMVGANMAPKTISRRVSSVSSFYKYLGGVAAELRLPIIVPKQDIASFIGNGPLAHAVEESIQFALARPNCHLVVGNSVLDIFHRSLDAVVRDIETHPQGVLFRRLVQYGNDEPTVRTNNIEKDDRPLTPAECEICVEFIKSHMVNRFKGDLAELLAIQPCLELVEDLAQKGLIPPSTQLYFGELIQERDYVGTSADGGARWGSFKKGADGLFVEHCPRSELDSLPSLRIHGVVEVKSASSVVTLTNAGAAAEFLDGIGSSSRPRSRSTRRQEKKLASLT